MVVRILWNINLCRLFNVKSIFMNFFLFQTIQFSMSTQFKCKYTLIVNNFKKGVNGNFDNLKGSYNSAQILELLGCLLLFKLMI